MSPLIRRLKPYGIAAAMVGALVILRALVLAPILGDRGPFSPFTLGILFSAWVGGLGPGLFATALCLGLASAFFLPAGAFSSPLQLALILVFTLTGVLLSIVCESLRRARRHAEASSTAARASEERFRLLADTAPVLIWIADQNKARSWFNKAWLEFTGQTMVHEQGTGWAQGVHPDDLERCLKIYTASFDARGVFDMDYRLRRSDGSWRWIFDCGAPMLDAEGKFLGYMGSCIDIHERKEAEQNQEAHLHREQAARAEAERIALLKDEFLATVSHEMRTPLTAILGWAQLLRKGLLTGDAFPQAVETIERNARTQAKLIEDLLDMSHILSGRLRIDVQRVRLSDVIEAALAAAEPAAAAKHIRIVRALEADATLVPGDPIRLQQVVWNLLNNAVKFTPSGGRITVSANRDDSRARISVTDSGEGIPLEFLPHVFDRFRQANSSTSRKHQGLGLGLSIVKQLVELHGGSVQAKSSGPGQGSTFIIELPISATSSGHYLEALTGSGNGVAEEDQDKPTPSLAGMEVLVVDDDEDTREMLRSVLEQSGAMVRTAASASEAISDFSNHPPSVLISDIGMPGEDGYELIRQVRALPDGGDVPALALTAFARSEDRRRAIAAGFQMHLAKPVEPPELVTVIASLANRSSRSLN